MDEYMDEYAGFLWNLQISEGQSKTSFCSLDIIRILSHWLAEQIWISQFVAAWAGWLMGKASANLPHLELFERPGIWMDLKTSSASEIPIARQQAKTIQNAWVFLVSGWSFWTVLGGLCSPRYAPTWSQAGRSPHCSSSCCMCDSCRCKSSSCGRVDLRMVDTPKIAN